MQSDRGCAKSELPSNKDDVCDRVKYVEAPKEVESNQNFVENEEGSHEKSPDKTAAPVKSSIKNTDSQYTDSYKVDHNHEILSEETRSPMQSSTKNTGLERTDVSKVDDSNKKVDGSHERSPDQTGSSEQNPIKNTDLKQKVANKLDDGHEIDPVETGSSEQSTRDNLQLSYCEKIISDELNVASNVNTEEFSREKEIFRQTKNFLSNINTRIIGAQNVVNDWIFPLLNDLRSCSKNNEKLIIDTIQKLNADIKTRQSYINNIKEGNFLQLKARSLDSLLFKISKEFVTKMNAALKLNSRQKNESFDEVKSDCIKFDNFLTKYSGQLKTANNILKAFIEKVKNDTLVFESERKHWNKIICGVKKNTETFSSETFSVIKVEKIIGFESQFSEIFNYLLLDRF